jgi:hypothetical protein
MVRNVILCSGFSAALLAVSLVLLSASSRAEEKAEFTIKDVMVKAHDAKDGLLKKILRGGGSEDDKKLLLDLYVSLWAAKPPKGDDVSWQKRSGDLIASAANLLLGNEGALDELKTAVNCKACHDVHKAK